MEIKVANPSEAFVEVLARLRGAPEVAARGLRTREVPERTTVVIARPYGLVDVGPARKLNHAISVLEGLSLVGQCSVPELQTDRVKTLRHFMSDGVFRGSYGPRVEGSLADLVRLLNVDRFSRQAVLSIYDSQRDLGKWTAESRSGDVPCTIAIQFLVRRKETNQVDMWVVMRSNDAWRGLPYDLGQFSFIHAAVATALNLRMGTYTHTVGSMHLYEEHWDEADELVSRGVGIAKTGDDEWPTWGGSGKIADTAVRARRLLMGEKVEHPTGAETWMADCLHMTELGQVIAPPTS